MPVPSFKSKKQNRLCALMAIILPTISSLLFFSKSFSKSPKTSAMSEDFFSGNGKRINPFFFQKFQLFQSLISYVFKGAHDMFSIVYLISPAGSRDFDLVAFFLAHKGASYRALVGNFAKGHISLFLADQNIFANFSVSFFFYFYGRPQLNI